MAFVSWESWDAGWSGRACRAVRADVLEGGAHVFYGSTARWRNLYHWKAWERRTLYLQIEVGEVSCFSLRDRKTGAMNTRWGGVSLTCIMACKCTRSELVPNIFNCAAKTALQALLPASQSASRAWLSDERWLAVFPSIPKVLLRAEVTSLCRTLGLLRSTPIWESSPSMSVHTLDCRMLKSTNKSFTLGSMVFLESVFLISPCYLGFRRPGWSCFLISIF